MIDAWLDLSQAALRERLSAGHPIDPSALWDSRYLGVSLGLPAWVDALAWKTFEKDFHRDPDTLELRGWNVRLQQTGWNDPPVPKTRRGRPVTFGHYKVTVEPDRLLLDYGLFADPLVAVERDGVEWLLGASLLKLGPWRPLTPSFFLLHRVGSLEHFV